MLPCGNLPVDQFQLELELEALFQYSIATAWGGVKKIFRQVFIPMLITFK
jgi:hypothetical protein